MSRIIFNLAKNTALAALSRGALLLTARMLALLLASAGAGTVLAQQASVPNAGGVAVANAATGADAFFDELGGRAGIDRIVDRFLQIVLQDSRIKSQFQEIDSVRLKEKLAEQFCQLSGGPCQYSGKSMELIHEGLRITQAQFNALTEDLQLAMEQQSIAPRIQNKLVARLAPMSRAIIGK